MVTHATSGQFMAVDAPLAEVWSPRDVKLVLYDEQTRPVGGIPGQEILSVAKTNPGVIVTVRDVVAKDPGDSIQTRG